MRVINLLLCVFFVSVCYSQVPGIQWQQTLGGSEFDIPAFSIKTTDNKIILVGSTTSSNGNFTTNHGGTDLWIEQFDLNGISQWRKLLGGTGNEIPVSYYYNTDGTIVIIGTTTTANNGNVTNNHGGTDIWLCKLNNDGDLLWQKCFGGTANETASGITKSSDGNYIITGNTLSSNGDITSNKGLVDAWIFKVNEIGTLVWQKTLGGSGQDGTQMVKAIESSAGNIYMFTETASNNGDVSGNHGNKDMWLIKLNSIGIIQWQNCYGGSSVETVADIKQSATGEIYIVGSTQSVGLPSFHGINNDYSDIYFCRVSEAGSLLFHKCYGGTLDDISEQIFSVESDGSFSLSGHVYNGGGDVVGYHGSATGSDIWVVKIGVSGTIQWQKILGGYYHDHINGTAYDNLGTRGTGSVIQTSDGGFLINAFTLSNDGDVAGYHESLPTDSSTTDMWIVKVSPTGQFEWQRTLGGARGEVPKGSAIEIGVNDFIITGVTNSTDGDINTNHGKQDGWMIRLGSVNIIKGTVFIDKNSNSLKDIGEPLYSNVFVKTQKPSDIRTSIPYNGTFYIESDTGTYTTSLNLVQPYFTIVPATHTSSFNSYFNTDSIGFALQPITGKKDLTINVVPFTVARPGFNLTYKIYYKNVGTELITSGEILFKKDSRLSLISSMPSISSSSGDTLKWNYSNFDLSDTASITLIMQVASPPVVNINDTLSSVAIITPVSGDVTPSDDTSYIKQRVQGSYDPNDKAENLSGKITQQQLSSGEYINYVIRFQNTGTDTAFNVVVRDTLDAKLDWNTLDMIAASHTYQLQINSGNKLAFTFDDINLPDSNINEPGSHGFIAYRIKPLSSLSVGNIIDNSASIYFDFNLPVMTNSALTEVMGTNMVLPLTLIDFSGVYFQEKAILHWSTQDEYNFEKFEIERSINGINFNSIAIKNAVGVNATITQYEFADDLTNITSGIIYYRLRMIDIDGKATYSNIIPIKNGRQVDNEIMFIPNPIRNSAQLMINSGSNDNVELRIISLSGAIMMSQRNKLYPGNNSITVDGLSKLASGSYFLQITSAKGIKTLKFVLTK
ncbi:MAG: T9SS type A sorting domain-containing protein [Chitinophagaceae bacterium]